MSFSFGFCQFSSAETEHLQNHAILGSQAFETGLINHQVSVALTVMAQVISISSARFIRFLLGK